jgi:YHS domain-containing protein
MSVRYRRIFLLKVTLRAALFRFPRNFAKFRGTLGETKEEAGVKHLRNVAMLALLAAGILLGVDTAMPAGEVAVALKGYDPVAYFTDKRPMVGDTQYQYEWDGAVYRFASAEHLALFKSDPDRYLPQYKNWCAASVAKGEKVYGNPEWWLVVDGRLYLFGKPIGPGLMSKEPAAMKNQADENWSKVSHLPDPPLPGYMRGASESR